jgi:hypothetical protein
LCIVGVQSIKKYELYNKLKNINRVLARKKILICLLHPTVSYVSETWTLKENMINKLMTFESKIMRKIYRPTRTEDGYWRNKTNQEINDILTYLLTYSME